MTVRLEVSLTADSKALIKRFGLIAVDQLPFATSKALNRTATEARDAVRESLPKRFSVRSKGFPGTV